MAAAYEEARGAESRADFIHEVGIANRELHEALYWLRLTDEAALVTDSELAALIGEANELVAILTASIRTAKQRDVTSPRRSRAIRPSNLRRSNRAWGSGTAKENGAFRVSDRF